MFAWCDWFDWFVVFDLDAHAQAHNTFSKNMPHAHAHTHMQHQRLIAWLLDWLMHLLIAWLFGCVRLIDSICWLLDWSHAASEWNKCTWKKGAALHSCNVPECTKQSQKKQSSSSTLHSSSCTACFLTTFTFWPMEFALFNPKTFWLELVCP